MPDRKHLSFVEHGAQHFPRAAISILPPLNDVLASYDRKSPGSRIAESPELAAILSESSVPNQIACRLAELPVRPVRAVFFDKNPANNWVLGWHQDRTIAVANRIETHGFGPWTKKQGLLHVQPPFAVIERMVTLRIHLDLVDESNGPLLVALGSHRCGKISERAIQGVASACEQFACFAEVGDIWAYSTPIIHASGRSGSLARRGVLQVDFSAEPLPNGLVWRGI